MIRICSVGIGYGGCDVDQLEHDSPVFNKVHKFEHHHFPVIFLPEFMNGKGSNKQEYTESGNAFHNEKPGDEAKSACQEQNTAQVYHNFRFKKPAVMCVLFQDMGVVEVIDCINDEENAKQDDEGLFDHVVNLSFRVALDGF
jgi:hypothetical protein